MCRLAAYLGPERPIHDLWFAPPHNLVVQSYAPKEMEGAVLNADGFGMAWYSPAAAEPARYRTVMPLWNDPNLPAMSKHLITHCGLANVRSATPSMGVQPNNVSPFIRGELSFTHNGFIENFRPDIERDFRTSMSRDAYRTVDGNTDSEHLFGLFLDEIDRGASIGDALRSVVERTRGAIGGRKALLTLIATDGDTLAVIRTAIHGNAPTLYFRSHRGFEFASERLDDGEWSAVEHDAIMVVNRNGEVRTTDLKAGE